MKLLCSNVSTVSPMAISIHISSSLQASSITRGKKAAATNCRAACGRRDLLLLSATALQYVADSKTQLLNEYLSRSQENKAKNDKERLDSYYKRNYKDYFGLLEGDLKGKKDLTESEKGILEWLKNNE